MIATAAERPSGRPRLCETYHKMSSRSPNMDRIRSSRPSSSSSSSSSLLQTPPPVRMSTPAGDRLSIIMENHGDQAPKIPQKHPDRWSAQSARTWRGRNASLPRASSDTMPPPYARYPWQTEGASGADDEKTNRAGIRSGRRGGWWRSLIILLAVLLLLAIGLGVGLGIGLTRRHKTSNTSA